MRWAWPAASTRSRSACAAPASAPGIVCSPRPLTAFATTLAILRAGAVPVWCDVDESGGLDLDRALQAVEADRSIRAVVPVHLYGHPLDPLQACRRSPGRTGRPRRGLCPVGRSAARRPADRHSRASRRPPACIRPRTSERWATAGCVLLRRPATGRGGSADARLRSGAPLRARRGGAQQPARRAACGHPALGAAAPPVRLAGRAATPSLSATPTRSTGSALRPIRPADGQSADHLFAIEVLGGDPARVAADAGGPRRRHRASLSVRMPRPASRGRARRVPRRARRSPAGSRRASSRCRCIRSCATPRSNT